MAASSCSLDSSTIDDGPLRLRLDAGADRIDEDGDIARGEREDAMNERLDDVLRQRGAVPAEQHRVAVLVPRDAGEVGADIVREEGDRPGDDARRCRLLDERAHRLDRRLDLALRFQ